MIGSAGAPFGARPFLSPMSRYALATGIGFCRFDDCTIVLDTRRDRYWQLEPVAGDLLASLPSDGGTDADTQFEPLIRLGFIVRAKTPAPKIVLPSPTRSLLENVAPELTHKRQDGIEVAWLVLTARLQLCLRPLDTVLARLAANRPTSSPPREALGALAHRFERARSLIPLVPRCLADTIAWLAFARKRGHAAHLVFGVRLAPFQAHCWAQSGDIVLNDALDHARRFCPILIV